MKPFQTYIFELTKPYEFRIKMAGIEPTGDVMEAIKHALETYQLESVGPVKHLPIQEHREFPNWGGACECWQFDVKVTYPTSNIAIQQVIKERANINPNWINVRNLQEADATEEAEALGKDHKGAYLDEQELKDEPGAQELAGAGRVKSLMAELEKHTRKYETAGKDTNADSVFSKGAKKGQTTNDKVVPQGNNSPVDSKKANRVFPGKQIGLKTK